MALALVPCGIFFEWSAKQLRARLAVVHAAINERAAGTAGLSSASENGKSFDFAGTGGMTFAQEVAEIQHALSYVDDDVYALPSETYYQNPNRGYN